MMNKKIFSALLVLLVFPAVCSGNSALPMLSPFIAATNLNNSLLVLGFIPIVILEAEVMKRVLKVKPALSAYLASGAANLASTAAGFVVIGGIGFAGSLIDGELQIWTMAPAAAVILLVAFFLSVWIEGMVAGLFFKDKDKKSVAVAVLKANKISYLILAILIVILLSTLFISPLIKS